MCHIGQPLKFDPKKVWQALEKYNCALIINENLENDYPGVYSKEIEDLKNKIELIIYSLVLNF